MGAATLETLRQQLREKFPQAHGVREEARLPEKVNNPFDLNGFPQGAISEVVPAGPGSGISLLVAGLLGEREEIAPFPEMILVDGADSFDPASYTAEACSKLLWVRCTSALEMIKAADLVVRDGNVPLVLLDATGLKARDLATIPASAWWRVKQSAERKGGRVIVLAPFPLVPCAVRRMTLSANLTLRDFDAFPEELRERLHAVSEGLRRAT